VDEPVEVFTLRQVARMLACHYETLRRAVRRGELQALQVGRVYRVTTTAVRAYVARRPPAPRPEPVVRPTRMPAPLARILRKEGR